MASRLHPSPGKEAEMNWLNDVLTDLQKMFTGAEESRSDRDMTIRRLGENRTSERVRQFKARLTDLDRRLAQIR